jgi:CBS domain-containing protein
MKVGEIMTETVISVRPSDRVTDAVRMMLDNRISGLPVISDAGQLVGIISEGDLLRRIETGTTRKRPRWLEFLMSPGRLADEYAHTHGRRVDEIMTPNVTTVTESSSLGALVQLMERRGIKRVPVVRDGKVVGIVTRANLMHAVAALQDSGEPPLVADTALRRHILDDIRREPWGPRYSVNVVVRNGRVDLWGSLFDERDRKALRVIVENAPGVKEIHDHMIWIEPLSGVVIDAPNEAAT